VTILPRFVSPRRFWGRAKQRGGETSNLCMEQCQIGKEHAGRPDGDKSSPNVGPPIVSEVIRFAIISG